MARLEQTEQSVKWHTKVPCALAQAMKLLVRLVCAMAEGVHMHLMSKLLNPRSLATLAPLGLWLLSSTAQAQTWVGNRQGPALNEILTIDATGETNWPWGAEDVAGDGLNNFTPAEQAIDARTVYVATDAARFYSRVYFSIADAQPGNVSTYVFIDTDRNALTGGSAAAVELDPSFTTDPSNGGYEYVIKVQRTAESTATGSIYQYDNTTRAFTAMAIQPAQLVSETNSYLDPIRVNQLNHGYLQSSVDINLVDLAQACQANMFVRSTNQTPGLGTGDLVVGPDAWQPCVATVNNTNVPDVVVPPPGCTTNAECPNAGVCINGNCILAQPCAVNTDCGAGYICDTGRCVYVGGTPCIDSSNCDGLVCQQGQCVVCLNDAACGAGFVCGPDGRCLAAGGAIPCLNASTCDGLVCQQGRCVACTNDAACGTGYVCGADGRCVVGTTTTTVPSDAGLLAPGERLQGGAWACRTVFGRGPGLLGLVGLLGLGALLGRANKRERKR